ncbi:hypothetical protein MPSI1_001948 [Malassezia psittaci]|uniref:Uncharacterized protein n=1 Tax=Malassezia psittaci TaxID=1821823 RepID=A0AAF0JDR6_9BASI|nr:hypothetical protein MPSI1_001948 [Malassezia psittaci]
MQASATPAPDQNVPSLSVEAQKKVQKGLDYKKQGNEAFLAHDYQRALHAYHHAVLYLAGLDQSPLTGIQPKAETIPTESTSIRQDHQELSQVRSNVCAMRLTKMAACYLQLGRFDRAIECCQQALKLNAKNSKAMYVSDSLTFSYRMTQAMVRNGDIYAAHSFLMSEDAKPYRSEPSYEEEKASIEKQIEERERQSNRSMRGFLGKRST